MSEMILWGFDGSTYVRTVKMVLAEKGVTDFKQVPLNVLKGEPKTPEHPGAPSLRQSPGSRS